MNAEEFEHKKLGLLEESKYAMWIKIDNGDTFEGTMEQLADCFGVCDLYNLKMFCGMNDMEYTVDDIELLNPSGI